MRILVIDHHHMVYNMASLLASQAIQFKPIASLNHMMDGLTVMQHSIQDALESTSPPHSSRFF